MNEENNVNQETEEKAKKMDEVFETSGEVIIKDVAKIAGRELTDEEKKEILNGLKAFFVLSSLMLKAFV